ncbi:MAG: aspartate kinase [Bacteroidales bacterium]|nr:aspartate kinase [Bacteroidales bacterium]
MKVFKFGGASVKDAASVRNVAHILEIQRGGEQLFVVVSAMGKTTNALEQIVHACYEKQNYADHFSALKTYQMTIAQELILASVAENPIIPAMETLFCKLEQTIQQSASYSDFDALYDAIVPFGELFSTRIIFEYLKYNGKNCRLINAFDWVKTDNYFRSAKVDIERSAEQLQHIMVQHPDVPVFITQGFIGSSAEGNPTTLGREGSDYTAALAASILQAESVTVWKDVAGLFNADPKKMPDAQKIAKLSYKEAVELAYYGAKIIHPKTIKPIENSNIPLYIKSFLTPEDEGTSICRDVETETQLPFFIFHDNQILISISVKDLSFITEESLHHIFGIINRCRVHVHLMQNSAISFSICVDNDPVRCRQLIRLLSEHYTIRYNENLELITVRHYQHSDRNALLTDKEILLEQRSRTTAQFVVRNLKN